MKWRVVKLGALYEVHNGLSKSRESFGSGFPFLSYSTVFNNFFLPNQLDSLVRTDDKEQASYSILKGDVFITRTSETSNELGMSCVALNDYPCATYNGFCKRLRPITEEVYPRYIGYYLRSPEFRSRFDGLGAAMITRASLKNEDLLAMTVRLPPLPIQQKIADILGAYDDLIENNRRRIELLEKMARELYRERFVRRAVGVKEFPLGEIAEFVRGKVIVKTATIPGDVPVVAGGLEPAYYHNDSNTKAPVVTVSGSGANAGFARMYFEKVWASDCSWVDAAGTKYIRFVYCFLKDNDAVLRNAQKGAAQPHVHAKDVNALTVAAEKTVISGFEESVIPIFDELANLEQQTRSLVKQRDRLLPRLMSGKIDLDKLVKEAE